MFKTNVKLALRALRKNKTQSAINILGLAIVELCNPYLLTVIGKQIPFDMLHQQSGGRDQLSQLEGQDHRSDERFSLRIIS